MNRLLSVVCCLSFTLALQAQSGELNPWKTIDEARLVNPRHQRTFIPNQYRTFLLDRPKMKTFLERAPMRFSETAKLQPQVLHLPMPDGQMARFSIVKAPVMHPDLAKKYPNMAAYAGYGLDDPSAYARFVWTPDGFHVLILNGSSSSVLIDPYAKGDERHYMSYYKKDYQRENFKGFACQFEGEEHQLEEEEHSHADLRAGDCDFRIYRLALACTGEYASFHGGTVPLVMQAMVVAMARVNGVFEKDLGLTTVLVPNNDTLIFLNRNTDPYNNGNGGAMLGQNQATVDARIGNSNYDIGHVFSTGGGGIASRAGNVCFNSEKAGGVTGQPSPINDPFTIDFVSHEMGHQLGGTHTQNNFCQRTNFSAMEPGSGSTIMGYAGICFPNVQQNSDDYFHAINLQQIGNYTTQQTGNTCPDIVSTNNNPPTVSAGANYTIPVSTPFELTAVANDDDEDVLTYCWEQMDNESGTMPPRPNSSEGPMFRSFSPVTNPTRTFPRLTDLVSNSDYDWEALPGVSRVMNFRVTVRDNSPEGGCTEEDDMVVNVSNTSGPFVVLNPNVFLEWVVNDFETVRWDVADTDQAPVSCSNVDILLSSDGGFTYPDTLAVGVPNTGSALITVPDRVSPNCRVKVICSDNIFFDISNNDFRIVQGLFPGLAFLAEPNTLTQCGSDDANFNIRVNALGGLNENVALSVEGVPMGATAAFSEDNILPSTDVNLTISDLVNAPEGQYDLKVLAEWSGGQRDSLILELNVFNTQPPIIDLATPDNGSKTLQPGEPISWVEDMLANAYQVDIATSPSFEASTIVETAEVSGNTYTPTLIDPAGIYYWRVRAINACGVGMTSDVFSFQLFNTDCRSFNSGNVPIIISSTSAGVYTSTLSSSQDFTIQDVDLRMNLRHSNVGDIKVQLVTPAMDTIDMFDRPGVPGTPNGCTEDDVNIVMDDAAASSADELENTCSSTGDFAIEGSFQPLEPLAALNGQSTMGVWTLLLEDFVNSRGGFIRSWGLDICFEQTLPASPGLLKNFALLVVNGQSGQITKSFLEGTKANVSPDDINYTLTALPANGQLLLSGTALEIGDVFSQQQINNDALSYQHDGSMTSSDQFQFDLADADGGWLPRNTFNINIIDGGQPDAILLLESAVSCPGDSTASIFVVAAGGTAPYEYKLDDGDFQDDNVFSMLKAGSYTVTIKDANGVEIQRVIEVTEPDPVVATAEIDFRTINITASGGSSFMYSLDGVNFQSSPVFTNVANGEYVVFVRNENGCIGTTDASIDVAVLTASVGTTEDITCFGDNDGSILVDVTDGIPPYQYSVNGGSFSSDNPITGLGIGNFAITVRDSIGQLLMLPFVTIEQPAALLITAETMDDSIFVSASGGTGDLEYSLDGTNYQSDTLFTSVRAGTYTVRVRDENGCIETTEVTITFVGLFDPLKTLQMEVFPNPSKGQFRIRLFIQTSNDLRIRLFDGLGRLIHREEVQGVGGQLDHLLNIKKLPTGVYHLEVSDGVYAGRAKVIIGD